MVRKPVVSGQFYPQSPEDLKNIIESFKPKETTKISAKGIILPHAGYVYSGKVATVTTARVLFKKRVIILGTNHSGLGEKFSLYSKGKWEIPLGEIAIDEDLALKILSAGKYVKEDTLAHKFEHSIEVELPILRYLGGEFRFVPIVCSYGSLEEYRKVGLQIYEAIKEIKEEVLLVASSDMTHYEPEAKARKKDRSAIEAILNLDEEDLLRRVERENISMCGVSPVCVLLVCSKLLGAKKAQVVLYQTSGESSGDYTSVVGYVGVVIS